MAQEDLKSQHRLETVLIIGKWKFTPPKVEDFIGFNYVSTHPPTESFPFQTHSIDFTWKAIDATRTQCEILVVNPGEQRPQQRLSQILPKVWDSQIEHVTIVLCFCLFLAILNSIINHNFKQQGPSMYWSSDVKWVLRNRYSVVAPNIWPSFSGCKVFKY